MRRTAIASIALTEIFLAAYEEWVSAEWQAVEKELSAGGSCEEIARRLVFSAIDFHTRWRGFRASLLQLVLLDPEVRRFYRAQRRRQLETIARLRAGRGGAPHRKEEDAIHLFTTERTFDAIANGQLAPGDNRSHKSADGRVATEAAWLNGRKREEVMERAKSS